MYLNNGNGLGFHTEYVRGESRDTTQLYAVRESPDSYQPLCVTCSLQQHRRNQVSVYFCCSITQKIPLKVHNGELYFLCRKDWILRTSTQSRVIKMSVLFAVETHFYLKRWKKQNTQYSVCWFQKSKLKGNIWNFDTLWSWNMFKGLFQVPPRNKESLCLCWGLSSLLKQQLSVKCSTAVFMTKRV